MTARRIDRDWADGTYSFELILGPLNELEQKTNAGHFELYERMLVRRHRQEDIRETIRLGLIGGGLEPVKALRLVRLYVDERPLGENLMLALEILAAAIVVPEGDEPKKAEAPNEQAATTAEYVSPTFTERVQ